MRNHSLLSGSLWLACGILFWTNSAPARLADAPQDPKDRSVQPAPPAQAAPPEPAPFFPGILMEGEKLPTPAAIRAKQKADADKADLDAALKESMNIAIRIGAFAVKLLVAIIIASLCGLTGAIAFTAIRGRHKQLMSGKVSLRMKKPD